MSDPSNRVPRYSRLPWCQCLRWWRMELSPLKAQQMKTSLRTLRPDRTPGWAHCRMVEKLHVEQPGLPGRKPSMNTVEVGRHRRNRSTGTWHDAQRPHGSEVVAEHFGEQSKRSVVERTRAWNERARRVMAHPDRSNGASLAWVRLGGARNLAARLASWIMSSTPSACGNGRNSHRPCQTTRLTAARQCRGGYIAKPVCRSLAAGTRARRGPLNARPGRAR